MKGKIGWELRIGYVMWISVTEKVREAGGHALKITGFDLKLTGGKARTIPYKQRE